MTNPLFDQLFAVHANNDAVFLHQHGQPPITFRHVLKTAAQFAHALLSLGAKTGDRIAVQVDKSSDVLALYGACVQAGLVFLPLNPAYTASELDYFVQDSGARILIGKPDQSYLGSTNHVTLGQHKNGSLRALANTRSDHFDTVSRGPDDLAAILYTSGTTGLSKGAMLTQTNLLSNAVTLTDAWQFTARDVLLHALPVFHTHGLFVATNVMLCAGGSMILQPRFDPDAVLSEMPNATTMMGVPTFYTRLLGHPQFNHAAAAHMRLFVSGSAPMLADTHAQFTNATGHRVLERYGMTETNMSTSNPYNGDRRAGTVGLPLAGVEVKVCDDAGHERPRGEVGTLEVRGDNVFAGYWNMPDKTATELRADGFFITGDLATMDADGYVTIVGRGKDLIIAGGLNIYPKEVETALDAHPDVLESAVIGVPHPDLGEAAVAIIVPANDSADAGNVIIETMVDLARFKHPRHAVMVDALPRNAMGKVQKAALRATYADTFTSD